MSQPLLRHITLIRHAKAEDDGQTQDHLRHLNARGKEDAAILGDWLRAQKAAPGLIVCSTALRTRETLEALAFAQTSVILEAKAYLASAGELLSLLQQTDDAVSHVALIAHNPGLHQLAATLAESVANPTDEDKLLLKFPTCACAQFSLTLDRWADLVLHSARLDQLRFPADG